MAKCLYPLFSHAAHGKFGGALVYQNTLFGFRVQAWYPRVDKPTPVQTVYRAEYGIGVSEWRTANAEMIAYYKELAEGKPMSGMNYMMKDYFENVFSNYCGNCYSGWGRCGPT